MTGKCKDAKSDLEFTQGDLDKLSRLIGKYGRERVLAEAEQAPLPRPRGRPKADAEESREYLEDVAYCLLKGEEEHRAGGSKTPTEDAWRDLYEVAVGDREKTTQDHSERWKQTIQRALRGDKNRVSFLREFRAYLEHARATAPLLSGKKPGAN